MPRPDGQPVRGLVVLENAVIDALVRQQPFRAAFPGLAALIRPVAADCAPCARKKHRTSLAEYRDFKNVVAAMSAADKTRLVQYLDAERVRVVHTAANRAVALTFGRKQG
jgi:hypothetical protein